MKLLTGNSNLLLAHAIAHHLETSLMKADIHHFSDGEVRVNLLEEVRNEEVFIIQSLGNPVNTNFMELLLIIDALKRSAAKKICAVIPYLGYARQDRKTAEQTPISAKLIANLLTTAGADHIITVDLHKPQIQGFFDIPVENLLPLSLFKKDILENFSKDTLIIMAADIGGLQRARMLAEELYCDVGIIEKTRTSSGFIQTHHIIGNIKDKICLFVDDIIDSGSTLYQGAQAVLEKGAKACHAYITHGVLSSKIDTIQSSLSSLVLTDSLPCPNINNIPIRILSLSSCLAQTIQIISTEKSLEKGYQNTLMYK